MLAEPRSLRCGSQEFRRHNGLSTAFRAYEQKMREQFNQMFLPEGLMQNVTLLALSRTELPMAECEGVRP